MHITQCSPAGSPHLANQPAVWASGDQLSSLTSCCDFLSQNVRMLLHCESRRKQTCETSSHLARNLWSPCLTDRVVGQTLTLHWHWAVEKSKRAPALTLGKRVWFYYLFIAGFVLLVCYFQLLFSQHTVFSLCLCLTIKRYTQKLKPLLSVSFEFQFQGLS